MRDGESEMLVFPLSYGQERIWFVDRLAPDKALFNLNNAFRFQIALEPAVLERALNEVVRRHESLRTSFRLLDEQPVQVVLPRLHVPLPVVDLEGAPPTEREQAVAALVREDATCPFDLANAPLIRTRLLRLGEAHHVLSLTIHHIVSDGWSLGVFLDELSTAWRAFAAGRPPALPELPVQYGDYSVWQRDWLQGEALERQLAYWRGQLRELPQLELPTDHPRPAVQSHAGGVCPLELSPELTRRVAELSRREGVTPFMTLLSAFQVLLHRYSGQDDIAVGSYIAGRNRAEVEPMIGFFLNTLVLRAQLEGRLSFRDVLEQVRGMTLDAYAHQDLPFAKLVAELEPARDLSRNPLVQVIFQIINVPTLAEGDGARSAVVEVDKGTSIFDLTCTLWESGDGMRGHLEYSTDLFEPVTVERMATHFTTLLEAALADPEASVARLPLLTEEERHLVVDDWNATAITHEDPRGILALWADQVVRRPDAPAFVCGGAVMTYADLDRRAEALAQRLRAHIGGPEALVGICLDRGLEVPVALLAVLKAGAGFLLLDPTYPQERLALMVADAQADVVVTAPALRDMVPDGPEVLRVDDGADGAPDDAGAPVADAPSDALAYVIFTSGSTGRPKGVAVSHRQVLNRLRWMWRAYPFAQGEVMCQKTAISFVDAIWELLGGLLQGIPTVIIPDAALRDPEAFVATLGEHRVSRIWVVPSFLRMLIDGVEDLGNRLPDLRFWVTTGEPIASELTERFAASMPHAILYNIYGTSEVWDATWWDPEREAPACHRVPIGRPIDNVQSYVLNALGQPVPVGIPGELHVGGAGLARGYLGLELTDGRFVAHPFSAEPGARLYRTGDLARFRWDGCIEFLGRRDQQVNVRGFRVEPAEVEASLARHPAVRTTVVSAHETEDGTQLVAYITLRAAAAPSSAELRRFLRERLPEYMIPPEIAVLDALPMTPSGKLDRTALPAPGERPRHARPAAPVAPQTELERTILAIWREVLRRDDVGLRDNFFDLGGHSMLLFRIGTRLRKILAREIPMNELFRHPTVEALAAWLADREHERVPISRARERARRRQAGGARR